MDEKTSQIIDNLIKKVGKKFKLRRVILFGSRARGDEFKSSDFDVILVSEDFKGMNFVQRAAKILEFWDEPYDLEALCYTPEEFEEKSKQICIVREAVRTGKVIK